MQAHSGDGLRPNYKLAHVADNFLFDSIDEGIMPLSIRAYRMGDKSIPENGLRELCKGKLLCSYLQLYIQKTIIWAWYWDRETKN